MDKYYCFPYKKFEAKQTLVSIVSKNFKGSEEIKHIHNNIEVLDKKNTALAGFVAKEVYDPAQSFIHLYVFNN